MGNSLHEVSVPRRYLILVPVLCFSSHYNTTLLSCEFLNLFFCLDLSFFASCFFIRTYSEPILTTITPNYIYLLIITHIFDPNLPHRNLLSRYFPRPIYSTDTALDQFQPRFKSN